MDLLIATANEGKAKEFSELLKPLKINVKPIYEFDKNFFMPEETGETFEENAKIKAESVYMATKMATLADDSGLQVDALNGAPGVYSARYAGENASDKEKIEKLLSEMKGVPKEKRTARFVCVICCILPGGEKVFSRGECEGIVSDEIHGKSGFGYDPIFLTSKGKTFAELSFEEKNKISHRGIALRGIYSKLKDKVK